MRNGTLHRRLIAVEDKLDQAAKAIGRKRPAISAKQAERTYRQLIKSVPKTRPEGSSKLTAQQAAEVYFREVRRTTLPYRERMQSVGR
jgi:hypothetical protein